jgi:ATP dependent DNA ligase-like protein
VRTDVARRDRDSLRRSFRREASRLDPPTQPRIGLTRSATAPYSHSRPPPRRFVRPSLPTKAPEPPTGGTWLHEIKHDGFRVLARKDGNRVRNDLTYRSPLIVEALTRLRTRSCIIDGEAVCCDDNGMASFDRMRYRRHDSSVFLYGFDLIELNGDDLRREPLASARPRSPPSWPSLRPSSVSTITSKLTDRPCSPMLARWASKASYRSVRTRRIAAGARRIGSNQKIQRAKP